MNTDTTALPPHPTEYLAIQVAVLHSAIRALHAAHADPQKIEALFQQLIGQMQVHPAFLESKESSELLRRFADGLFQPIVRL
jgi:hypothetical protein